MAELHRQCREGRLYDVERWITRGRPLQVAKAVPFQPTALSIAIERDHHSLVLLLLCNGYDSNCEPQSPLDMALRKRRWDYVDLLLEYGADPKLVDVDTLCDTYNSSLYERFWSLGVDMTSGHAIAWALATHSNNKPLFGFVKRHLADEPTFQLELDIALAHHAGEGHEKGALLCLWAGANAHTPVHTLRHYISSPEVVSDEESDDEDPGSSAIFEACQQGHASILSKLAPDPAKDDFARLYDAAPSAAVVDVLAKIAPPRNADAAVRRSIARIIWTFDDSSRAIPALRRLFEVGARWNNSSEDELTSTRRTLLKMDDWAFTDVLRLLAHDDYCSPAILKELARSSSFRARMKRVGLIPVDREALASVAQSRDPRSREFLTKFGVVLPAPKPRPKPPLPRTAYVGPWSSNAREIRLDRQRLYDLVWAKPTTKLANEWGMSGRGLAKACRRLRIPVPPRGYWAKVAVGGSARRAMLPSVKPGEVEEVIVRLSESGEPTENV